MQHKIAKTVVIKLITRISPVIEKLGFGKVAEIRELCLNINKNMNRAESLYVFGQTERKKIQGQTGP